MKLPRESTLQPWPSTPSLRRCLEAREIHKSGLSSCWVSFAVVKGRPLGLCAEVFTDAAAVVAATEGVRWPCGNHLSAGKGRHSTAPS